MSERAINILCFYERRGSNGKLKIECEEHVVRASMAEERLRELLGKVVRGELESFIVRLSDCPLDHHRIDSMFKG